VKSDERVMRPFTKIAGIFLFLISALHILRILLDVEIVINSWYVPFWINGIAAVVTGFLAIMLWKEGR
jgi:hypothetical protein